jgi:hypothetical protein
LKKPISNKLILLLPLLFYRFVIVPLVHNLLLCCVLLIFIFSFGFFLLFSLFFSVPLLFFQTLAVQYVVSRVTSTSYSVTKDGATHTPTSLVAETNGQVSINTNQLSFYSQRGLAVSLNSLPALLQNQTFLSGVKNNMSNPWVKYQIYQVTTNIYYMQHGDDYPFVTVFGSLPASMGSGLFNCNRTVYSGHSKFFCWSLVSAANFLADVNPPSAVRSSDLLEGNSNWRITISSLAADQVFENEFVSFIVSKDMSLSRLEALSLQLKADIDHRRDKARVSVGFLWFFVAFTMFAIIVLTSLFQSWCWPVCFFTCCCASSTCCRADCFSIKNAVWIWTLSVCVLILSPLRLSFLFCCFSRSLFADRLLCWFNLSSWWLVGFYHLCRLTFVLDFYYLHYVFICSCKSHTHRFSSRATCTNDRRNQHQHGTKRYFYVDKYTSQFSEFCFGKERFGQVRFSFCSSFLLRSLRLVPFFIL